MFVAPERALRALAAADGGRARVWPRLRLHARRRYGAAERAARPSGGRTGPLSSTGPVRGLEEYVAEGLRAMVGVAEDDHRWPPALYAVLERIWTPPPGRV